MRCCVGGAARCAVGGPVVIPRCRGDALYSARICGGGGSDAPRLGAILNSGIVGLSCSVSAVSRDDHKTVKRRSYDV